MSGEPSSIANLLRPVLDTYRESAVVVVGCHSTGIARESCEIDAVVVSDETRGPTSFKMGETFCELRFISEKEALRPIDPEVAVSLAQSRVVKDTGLILSTSLAANQAILTEKAVSSSQQRLTACLKALSRTDEALLQGAVRDANYWVLSASYEFARSWLYSLEVIPSPSHLLEQLKEHSKGSGRNFEAFAKGAGLEIASRKECNNRLEGLSLLYDLLSSSGAEANATQSTSTEVSFRIAQRKADHLAVLKEPAENYSFLGSEVAQVILAISESVRPEKWVHRPDLPLLSSLFDVRMGLLSGRLIRELGLERPVGEVKESLVLLKERAAKLARKI